MKPFIYRSQPGRVVFGAGNLAEFVPEIERLRAARVVVLSTPGRRSSAEDIAQRLGARCAGIVASAVMHVPIETVRAARAAIERLYARDLGAGIGIGHFVHALLVGTEGLHERRAQRLVRYCAGHTQPAHARP